MTDPDRGARGASAFIVENGTEGLSFGKKEKKLGIRCSATREVILEDCRIPRGNLLGREGRGFIVTLKTLDLARVGVGAQGVGLCAGALEYSIEYARQRHQFGKPIASFQAIQHMLARMATHTEAARALVYAVAKSIDAGQKDQSKDAAMSKLFASDVAVEVASNAIQVLGGYGYMRDYPVEKMLRDAKILQIYEGTNQIQCNNIASALIKEAASKS
jgi:butyryl-CoA dehydrogenase